MTIQLVRELVSRDPRAAAQLLDDMSSVVLRALEQCAQLAQRVYPPLLESGGLGAAMRAAAVATGARTEISVAGAQLPRATAGAVYFCWLDALESARDGRTTTVVVAGDDCAVSFEIERDAPTFSTDVLSRMRDRVEAVGGRLTVARSADGRTTVTGRLALSR